MIREGHLDAAAGKDVGLQQPLHGGGGAGVQLRQERHRAAVVQRALQAVLRQRRARVLQRAR